MMKFAFAIVLWLGLHWTCSAQPGLPTDFGTHAFRAILHRMGMQPVTKIETILENPEKSLLIVVGETDVMPEYLLHEGLRNFIKRGGAALFASDEPTQRLLINELEIIIDGEHVYCRNPRPDTVYRGEYIECPYLHKPIRSDIQSNTVDLLQGLRQVATNRPSFLRPIPEPQQTLSNHRVVAESPQNFGTSRMVRMQFPPPPSLRLAIADNLERGRYCVIADHSIFINSMLLQTDNDNIAFTTNVINWLTENGQRNQVMFIDDGQVRSEFDFNLDYIDPPLPHPDVIAPAIDKLVLGLEQDNFFNRTITRLIPLNRLLRYLLLGLTIGMAALVLYRITAGKHRREAHSPRMPDRVESLADTTPLEQRIGNATDPAVLGTAGRELAHRTFRELLGQEVNTQPVIVGANFWSRRKWTRRIDHLWRLAASETPRTLSASELKQLARQLDQLRQAVDRGTVQLLSVEDPG